MSWEALLTVTVVAGVVVALVKAVTTPAVVVLGATIVLLVTGVIEPGEAFAGFSNPAPITVAALYIVAGGIQRTGLLNRLVDAVMGTGGGERRALGRLLVPAAGASAFLNNTPIVAMLVPPVSRWAGRVGRSVSPLLMPLSYAAMLGGMLTLIGTSTNIVVAGLMEAHGLAPLGFFEIGGIGLPVVVVGLAVILVLAPLVLPDRVPARRDIEDVREFVVEMRVDAGGALDGLSVHDAGLRHLVSVFLAQIERQNEAISPVAPEMVLRGGDLLRFIGNAHDIADLQGRSGLTAGAQQHVESIPPGTRAFFEAVIGASSPLVGSTLKSIGFRDRYQAAVLAIHRSGARVQGKLGEVRLRTGDTLLLLAPPVFRERWHGSSDFLLVSRFDGVEPDRSNKAIPAFVIGIAIVATAGTGLVPILEASLLGALAVVALGVLSPAEARAAVDLDVILVIAASFGIGAAISRTGLAADSAGVVVSALEGFGAVAVLLGIALVTTILTEAITNNAAAVLVFPIAMATADSIGADPRVFAIVVAVAASASFLTPIGYQTNTMVWGPGGYRFGDYARLGLPLTITMLVTIALAAPL